MTSSPPPPRATPPLPGGAWPVILTPFNADRKIDWAAYERLIDWYIENGASGLFASCLSSEMFHLTFAERKELVRRAVRHAGSRVPVVSSGALGATPLEVAGQVNGMADMGPAAVVLLTNQGVLAEQDESAFRSAVDIILESVPSSLDFGLYECPVPAKRLISPETVGELARTNRFVFFKETSCHPDVFEAKVRAAEGTRLGIYAADNPTLLTSLQRGGRGYSGIAASGICAELSTLCDAWSRNPDEAGALQNVIGPASVVIGTRYPASAKYLLRDVLGEATECRWMDSAQLTESDRYALDQLAWLLAARRKR
ncbi:MAG: dihydrodipicolinate synthase family protein [Opitutaceae bacterium]|jgi:4-hydroxy-tetrahydrodipicolinate synthase|nr:dihydrodipicolinate synthase family protein [Opitutaceae bacterium]